MFYFEMEIAGILLALGFMFFLSMVESAISQSNPLTLRTMLEQDAKRPSLLPVVLEDKMQVIVPVHFGIQLSLITIAILTTHLSLSRAPVWGVFSSFAIILFLSLIFRQLLPRLMTLNEPERKLARLLVATRPLYRILRSLAFPLWGVLRYTKRKQERAAESESEPENEEASEKEIQAYLEIGEDEGILERADSEMIQSVVEFGDTLVREVMTPRPSIIACPVTATLSELRDIMVLNKHSRIPIYREDMDHIVGIAYIRNLLAEYGPGKEKAPVTIIVHPALFVPETKLVSVLLKELQERGDHTAMVVDEFGGVAGLVTIEDLIEEIVGEIRDEDQAKVSEIVEESPGTYVLRGSTELSRLEELLDTRFEDNTSSTTIAGQVMSFLGRVPAPGEEFEMDGIRVRVLDADRKRVHRLRIERDAHRGGAENLEHAEKQ
jgi:putative hemolysin